MRIHMSIAVLLTVIVAWGAGLRAAQPASDQASVVAAVQGLHAAIAKGDAETVTRLLAEDVVIFEAGGMETLGEYVKNHLPADAEFEKAIKSKRSPIRAQVAGETAWASSTNEMVGTFQGRAVDLVATELVVLSRAPDGWRIRAISWSSRSRAKPAAAPAK
jgi:ketosteroid isomerase-like protein